MAPNSSDLPIFDPSKLDEGTRGNNILASKVLSSYLQILERNRSGLVEGLSKDDRTQMGRIAHSMRSSSMTVGALLLGHLLDRLENKAEILTGAEVEELVGHVLQAFDATTEMVRIHREQLGGGTG